ncbi:hypothetical protein [Halorubrum cibi]|uniref:Uncharacterized protein n=1 Tax=Halorubrum cibi TaxID=413815 RepID=A0A521AZU0_9EURY|nr:hypothetical protein [Halorubrum cibi]SMO40326.1 hypothetical protein SAMN06264867_101500 [Halorubrum cibi]
MSSGERVERDPGVPDDESPAVAMSRTTPDRTVFIEEGNTDAWIATDLTVETER